MIPGTWIVVRSPCPFHSSGFFTDLVTTGREEFSDKERGLLLGVGDVELDTDLSRSLPDLPGSGRGAGWRCSHSLQGAQMSSLARP